MCLEGLLAWCMSALAPQRCNCLDFCRPGPADSQPSGSSWPVMLQRSVPCPQLAWVVVTLMSQGHNSV